MIHDKSDWLHAEGISHTVYALAEAGCWDERTWTLLKEKIESKDFDYEIVKNTRWDPTQFKTMTGSEHFFEAELSKFANDLFFQGNLYFP